MRCTSCSREVRPVVAVDIDGTLGDYHTHFLRFANDYLGLDPYEWYDQEVPYRGGTKFKRWFIQQYETDERTWNDIKLAYRQGGMKRSMPIFPGAAELCHSIRAAGSELWLTTTRPFLRLDNVDPDTRFWLELHGIEYDGLLYDEFKYERLGSQVDRERVVAVLDDLPEMFNAAGALFGWRTPMLRRTPYNAAVVTDTEWSDLFEVAEEITRRIKEWSYVHTGNGSEQRVGQGVGLDSEAEQPN